MSNNVKQCQKISIFSRQPRLGKAELPVAKKDKSGDKKELPESREEKA